MFLFASMSVLFCFVLGFVLCVCWGFVVVFFFPLPRLWDQSSVVRVLVFAIVLEVVVIM